MIDPEPEVNQPSPQRRRAELLKQYINQNMPEGYFVNYTWQDDPLEILRVEFENVVTHRKSHTDLTFETLLRNGVTYNGKHVITTLVQADTDAYVRE